ncbi:phosphatidate cytidylyltransferase [Hyphomicrobium facile]|uniref:Phosphatidate cytidylyltransferase n=1 Tax=Hyphomicrobium facile TaxID=51670 RepID=A0A1I7NG00_9HYPH|nr:phosphatidate cytidylyltransferase [Hyphomicrobium facile]SFV33568.1 phosphatidate cytidylyltransferase [Hyphomicrobium facile]
MPADNPDNQRPFLGGALDFIPYELRLRIASGVAIGVVAFAMLYWSPAAFAVLTFLIAAAMSWEWGRIVRGEMPDRALVVHIIAVFIAAVLVTNDMAGLSVLTAVVGAAVVAALAIGSGRARLSGAGVMYTALPVVALVWLRSDEPLGFLATLFVLIAVAVTDIAAYVSGRTIGGPKLWPEISPNKTWSGLLGGITAAGFAGLLFSFFTGSGTPLWLAGLGLATGLVAQCGDLAESALKRHFGLKDSGGLIPGHGGFMDRMDGIVTASVLAALIGLAIDAYAPARALLYGS